MSNLKSRPIRTTSLLLALSVVALAATARAQGPIPAPAGAAAPPAAPPPESLAAAPAPAVAPAATPEPARRKLQVGLAFLPMARGKLDASSAGMSTTVDGAFAYGVGLSVGYEILPGLSVGLAPQVTFNGKPKDNPAPGGKQWDAMARIAYAYTIPDIITLYAEVLPGYSIYYPPMTSGSKGFIVAAGVGGAIDITEQVFVNLGVGYQMGFQSQSALADYQTNYVRVALGGGMKF
jgi:hypothetical protein